MSPAFSFVFFFFLREGKGRKKRGGETSMYGCLSRAPLLGTWPTTQARALTRNRTDDSSFHRLALSTLSHISQGYFVLFQRCFDYSGSLAIPWILKWAYQFLQISHLVCWWGLCGICMWISFEYIAMLTMLSLSICAHEMFSHLFKGITIYGLHKDFNTYINKVGI